MIKTLTKNVKTSFVAYRMQLTVPRGNYHVNITTIGGYKIKQTMLMTVHINTTEMSVEMMRKAKKQYNTKLITRHKGNSKLLWKTIKDVTGIHQVKCIFPDDVMV